MLGILTSFTCINGLYKIKILLFNVCSNVEKFKYFIWKELPNL